MPRTFAWHRIGWSGHTYPVLWEGEIPSFTGSAYKQIVAKSYPLTEADEQAIAGSNRGVLAVLAERYPQAHA